MQLRARRQIRGDSAVTGREPLRSAAVGELLNCAGGLVLKEGLVTFVLGIHLKRADVFPMGAGGFYVASCGSDCVDGFGCCRGGRLYQSQGSGAISDSGSRHRCSAGADAGKSGNERLNRRVALHRVKGCSGGYKTCQMFYQKVVIL